MSVPQSHIKVGNRIWYGDKAYRYEYKIIDICDLMVSVRFIKFYDHEKSKLHISLGHVYEWNKDMFNEPDFYPIVEIEGFEI